MPASGAFPALRRTESCRALCGLFDHESNEFQGTKTVNSRLSAIGTRLSASVLLLLLAAGLVEVHHHGLVLNHDAGGGARSGFASSATHPNQPCHFEEGGETETPPCAACLYGLTARALLPSLAPAPRAAVRGERLLLERIHAPCDPGIRWVHGRSPPLA